jgi:uncharacterized protein YycO
MNATKTKTLADYALGPVMCRPGIALFRGRGVVSTLIRWQTRSVYSHAALVLPDGRIVEAWQGDGVRVKRLDDWSHVDRFEVADMTDEQWIAALDFALRQVGQGYDYWAIMRFVSRRHMPDNDRWFCSELVFAALEAAGVRLFERIEAWAVSPGLLAIAPRLTGVAQGYTHA